MKEGGGMQKEPASLPALLTFGPGFMLMGGLIAARSTGDRDWVAFGIAVLGTLMLSRGLIMLLRAARASSVEIERWTSRSSRSSIPSGFRWSPSPAPDTRVQCERDDDVARCIDFARRQELKLAVRSGGHSFLGWGTGT